MPCSETDSPIFTARSRSLTLCSFEPVKCCSRLPNSSGGTIRRSSAIPLWVRARRPFSLGFPDSSISGCSASSRASASGSVAVATMSMSLQVSVQRRAEPASTTFSAASLSRSAVDELVADLADVAEQAPLLGALVGHPVEAGEDVLLELRAEAPQVAQLAGLGRRAQLLDRRDPGLVVDPPDRLGADAGDPRDARRAWPGASAFSFDARPGSRPRSSRATIFSWIVSPIPCSSVARPSSASSPTGAGLSAIARAASR